MPSHKRPNARGSKLGLKSALKLNRRPLNERRVPHRWREILLARLEAATAASSPYIPAWLYGDLLAALFPEDFADRPKSSVPSVHEPQSEGRILDYLARHEAGLSLSHDDDRAE